MLAVLYHKIVNGLAEERLDGDALIDSELLELFAHVA
jgi:hypothetical protein